MWNVVGNGDVECDGEWQCGIWLITLTWNMVENGGVGMWRITLTWNALENGYVKYGVER